MSPAEKAEVAKVYNTQRIRALDAVLSSSEHADDADWMEESAKAMEFMAGAYRVRARHIRAGKAVGGAS